jgi:hypothetical protein
MMKDSAKAAPVESSTIAGRVYIGLPSGHLDVGGIPAAFKVDSTSGYSIQTVLKERPLYLRESLQRYSQESISVSESNSIDSMTSLHVHT